MSEVNNKIANFRSLHKMSQQDLANAIGVSRKTISTVETGRFTPSVTIALRLASFFQTPVEEIFSLVETDNLES